MRKHGVVIGLALASFLAANGVAAAKSDVAGKDPSEKIVCKNKARTGTRFTNKTCRTAAEWDQIAEAGRRQMAEMNGPTISTAKGN